MFSIAGIARSGAAVMDGVQHYYKGLRRATLAQQLLPAPGAQTAHTQQQGSVLPGASQSALGTRNHAQTFASTLAATLSTVEE